MEGQNSPGATFGSCLAVVYGVKAAQVVQIEPTTGAVFSAAGGIHRGEDAGAWVGLGVFLFILGGFFV